MSLLKKLAQPKKLGESSQIGTRPSWDAQEMESSQGARDNGLS